MARTIRREKTYKSGNRRAELKRERRQDKQWRRNRKETRSSY